MELECLSFKAQLWLCSNCIANVGSMVHMDNELECLLFKVQLRLRITIAREIHAPIRARCRIQAT